jgi:hypothetical protein
VAAVCVQRWRSRQGARRAPQQDREVTITHAPSTLCPAALPPDKLEFSYTFDNRIILKKTGKRNSMFFCFSGHTLHCRDKNRRKVIF